MIQKVIYLDGTEQEVTVRYGDRLRAEREMTARGFGTPAQAAGTWLSVATHRAALRDGLTDIQDPEEWFDMLDNIITPDAEETEEGDNAPFEKGHSTVS